MKNSNRNYISCSEESLNSSTDKSSSVLSSENSEPEIVQSRAVSQPTPLKVTGSGAGAVAAAFASQKKSAHAMLSQRQICRLRTVLNEEFEVHGRGNFPMLTIQLRLLILTVRERLRAANIDLRHIRLNGGAASHVIADADFPFSDLDLIFNVDLPTNSHFEVVRDAVMDALLNLLPEGTSREKIDHQTLKDVYIRKMVKVCQPNDKSDRWSLFALNNHYGRCIELKFVDKMRRQFEFSVDSFQLCLDPLLDSVDMSDAENMQVPAESMFGNFAQAVRHLNDRLIDTRRPEEIRGGGLLKYGHLLVRGYRPAQPVRCRQMERYMCSRFFIDFPAVISQEAKLVSYVKNHLCDEDLSGQHDFLLLIRRIIAESTVCLMNHERRQTLLMIERLAYELRMKHYYTQQRCCLVRTPSSVSSGGSTPTGSGSVEQYVQYPQMQQYQPRQTLLYLPRNAQYWIPVV